MLTTNQNTSTPTSDSERLKTLYAVNKMFNQITAGLDINFILPRVLRMAINALGAQTGSIFIFDQQYTLEHTWLIEEGGTLIDGESSFLNKIMRKGLAGQVARTGEPIVVADTTQDARWISEPSQSATQSPWSAICVPLPSQERVIGTITVAKPGAGQFNESDLDLLTAVATQAAHTITNARLYQSSRRHTDELSALVAATTAISSTLDEEQVTEIAGEELVQLLAVDAGVMLDWNQNNDVLIRRTLYVHQSSEPLEIPRNKVDFNLPSFRRVLTDLQPLQLTHTNPDLDDDTKSFMEQLGLKTVLVLPLAAHHQTLGLAVMLERQRMRTFSESEISLAQTLTSQAAVAIQNARLYSETQRQLKMMQLLHEASRVINSSLDLNQIMQSLLTQMNEFLMAEALSVALVDKRRNELVFSVSEGIGSDKIIGLRIPSTQGVAGWVTRHGEPAMVNDTSQDARFSAEGDERTGHPTRAIICAPIQVKEQVLGTIQAINPTAKDEFTQNDLNLLINLANLASSAMANAQQYTRTQAAEARYMGLFQDSIDPIILTDKTGKILEVNGRAIELLGYDRSELLRLRINNLHPVETGLLGERQFKPIQTRQIKMFTSEIITKDKRRTPVEVYAKRIFMGDNQILQWIYHDITEQIELEQMREDLTAMLFHDLQSPLGNIISSLELVMEDLPEDSHPALVSMVDVAIKSGERLQRLVKSLLDVNRLEAGHPIRNQSYVSVMQLLDDAQETLQATIERRNITVERNLPLFMPDVYVDQDMIRRVVINLMDNALKYSQDGQTVTIEVSEATEEDRLVIAVSDEGPGVPRRYRAVIFEKFRRVQEKQSRKGIGLGLAFCRLAVEAHNGRIWVDAGPRGGARFNFTLPITGGY